MIIVFDFILVFLFTFGPVFNRVGPWLDTIFIVSAILVFWHVIVRKRYHLPSYVKMFFILIPLAFVSLLTALLHQYDATGSEVFASIFSPVRVILTLLGGYFVCVSIQKSYADEAPRIMLQLVFWSVALHAGIMVLQFYSVGFRNFVYAYTTTGQFRSSFEYNFRMGGFSGTSGGAMLSVAQSAGLAIAPFLLKVNKGKSSLLIIAACILIASSILICGRSGLWSALVFVPVAFVLSNGFSFKVIAKMTSVALLAILSIAFLVNFAVNRSGDNLTSQALGRTLDTFVKLQQTGQFQDESVSTLEGMVLLPDEVSIILFGDGEHLLNKGFGRELNSDIGYIRNLWGYGFIGTLLFLLPFLFGVAMSIRYFATEPSARILLVISMMIAVFHAKESAMYARMLLSIWAIFIAMLYLNISGRHLTNSGF
jgi:hypothetical protein